MKSLEDIKLEIKKEKLGKLKENKNKLLKDLIKIYLYEETSKYVEAVFNSKEDDFKTLHKLNCLNMSSRDYLIIKVMEEYRKHSDIQEVKKEFYDRICRRYGLEKEDKIPFQEKNVIFNGNKK